MDKVDIRKEWELLFADPKGLTTKELKSLFGTLTPKDIRHFLLSICVDNNPDFLTPDDEMNEKGNSIHFDSLSIRDFIRLNYGAFSYAKSEDVVDLFSKQLSSLGYDCEISKHNSICVLPPKPKPAFRYHWEHKDRLSFVYQIEFKARASFLAREYFKTGKKILGRIAAGLGCSQCNSVLGCSRCSWAGYKYLEPQGYISPAYLDPNTVVYTFTAKRLGKPYPPTIIRWRRVI